MSHQDSPDHKDPPWWLTDIPSALQPQTRDFLHTYAGIPPDQQISHIAHTRQQAYDLFPYPSIAALTWLNPYLTLHPSHDLLLDAARAGKTVLDCGCFVAPDLRYLAAQGAPTRNLVGFDIEPAFFEIGFDFYRDREKWEGRFIHADGEVDVRQSGLRELVGEVDVVWCPKYLHIYDREGQVQVAANLVRLLRPVKGSLFVGSQNGMVMPEEIDSFVRPGKKVFLGNAETLREMWGEVAALTGTRWEVEARLLDLRTLGLHGDDGSEYKRKTGYVLQWTATLIEVRK